MIKKTIVAMALVALVATAGLAIAGIIPPDLGLHFLHANSADIFGGGLVLSQFGAVTAEDLKVFQVDMQKKADEVVRQVEDHIKPLKADILELQQKGVRAPGAGSLSSSAAGGHQAFVDTVLASQGLKDVASGARKTVRIPLPAGSLNMKTAILNDIGTSPQALVVNDRVAGIKFVPQRRLTIRGLMSSRPTDSNRVDFVKESVFSSSAAIVFGSPNSRENVPKPESGMTFTLESQPVETIAHWIPASRQVLSDSNGLADHLSNRLLYGLALAEEAQMLTGDGTTGNLSGLLTNATTYNRGVSNDTMLDCLAKAILQLAIAEGLPTGIVLNPVDWNAIRLIKDTQGRYLFGDPSAASVPAIWGSPVVPTNSMTQGQFLVGDFMQGAEVHDRQLAVVEFSLEHDDFFTKNMVAILCEERVALTVYKPSLFIKGTLPTLGT
jgi:HK97 family phage major capsid protein